MSKKRPKSKWSVSEFQACNEIWNVAVHTKVSENCESSKDFLENKSQTIELSAKIESISRIIIVHRQKLDQNLLREGCDNTIALRRL